MKGLCEYNFPEDLKGMSKRELELLSYQIREYLIEKVAKSGGHLASNLGVVELTIALHKVFDSPKDKIIWDVGHQAYIHKILTGRAEGFDCLRGLDGLSGFPKRRESAHDMYDAGHASTSLSIAAGYARARDLSGGREEVIAVIGDGSMTGGIAFEALNNIGSSNSKLIVVLNDNEMSIDKSRGGLTRHFKNLRTSKAYLEFKRRVREGLKDRSQTRNLIYHKLSRIRDSIRYALIASSIFEDFGFKYLGPLDGHNIEKLTETLELCKSLQGPVLLHVVTRKGKGYKNAENDPGKFHGIGAFDKETGLVCAAEGGESYSKIAGGKLLELALANDRICAITAAMTEATGLLPFKETLPDRFFDVGIAEQHAVSFAAGLALAGYRPFVAIYSTFLQRAYDQLIMDICLQKLPVIFLVDRAGNVGNDGETHHGMFDLSYFSHMPGMTVMAPKDGEELLAMMDYALTIGGPVAIRYSRSCSVPVVNERGCFPIDGKVEIMREGKDLTMLAIGRMVEKALLAGDILVNKGIEPEIINARFLKPLDIDYLVASVTKTGKLVTLEDNIVVGGLASSALTLLSGRGISDFRHLAVAWPDKFIEQGNTEELFKRYGMDADSIAEKVGDFLEGKA